MILREIWLKDKESIDIMGKEEKIGKRKSIKRKTIGEVNQRIFDLSVILIPDSVIQAQSFLLRWCLILCMLQCRFSRTRLALMAFHLTWTKMIKLMESIMMSLILFLIWVGSLIQQLRLATLSIHNIISIERKT